MGEYLILLDLSLLRLLVLIEYRKYFTLKVIPSSLTNYLTPLALAIWVMDDGCKIKNRGFKFCTDGFTLTEVKFLSSILKNKYGLNTSIVKTGAVNQYYIYITKSSLNTLINLVKPFIHESMLYKLYDL